ncbi:MAG: aminotransferase class I/II-fold pyridoxal phosphate-dependent enzyme [Oceanospirillales bacterium]|nr:MAG: aminotransferase class I/II-fold pyridoxal phosphate-dependent enzyme [Oceanospirillales bacterium]
MSYPKHLLGEGPDNPFPGLKSLERRLGHEIPYRLGSNEGLDMPHHLLRQTFGDAFVAEIRSYGDAEAYELRQRLSHQLNLSMDNLLVDAGADSLLALALRGLVSVGETVICTAGTYPTFAYFAKGHGCHLIEVPYRSDQGQLAPDLDALAEQAHRHQARLVYVANPDNPTGYQHSDKDLLGLRDALPDNSWLILDEAYHDFREDQASSDVVEGVLRVRSFSKAHGLAGLRVGYAIGSAELLAMLMKVRIHYVLSSVSLAAVTLLLDHPDEITEHIQQVKDRRKALTQLLCSRGLKVLPSHTNFVAVVMDSADKAAEVQTRLLAQGILVTRPAHPAVNHLLRITALDDALGSLSECHGLGE